MRREELAERRVFSAPAHFHELQHQFRTFALPIARRAQGAAARITTMQDQMRHAFRVLDRISYRDRRALGDAEKRKPLEARRVNDELEIAQPRLEAQVLDVPVGKAASTLVIADEAMRARQFDQPMPPHGAVPIELDGLANSQP